MDICSFHIIHTFLKADVSVSNLNRILGIKKTAYSNEINGGINTEFNAATGCHSHPSDLRPMALRPRLSTGLPLYA